MQVFDGNPGIKSVVSHTETSYGLGATVKDLLEFTSGPVRVRLLVLAWC